MATYESYQRNWLFILGGKVADLLILSCLWIIFSIPIITFGASTAALYYSVIKRFRSGREPALSVPRLFWNAFKSNAKQGIALSIIYIIFGAFVAFDILAARGGIEGFTLPSFYEAVAYCLILPVVFTLFYVFPCISRFKNTVKASLKNSFLLSATHFLHTLILLVLFCLSVIVVALYPPCGILVPALCCLTGSFLIEKDFIAAGAIAEKPKDEDESLHAEISSESRFPEYTDLSRFSSSEDDLLPESTDAETEPADEQVSAIDNTKQEDESNE